MLIMQAIVETLFDTVYLFSVITIGILMIRKSKGNRQFTMFGIMAVLLGSGDAFHLVPRAVALCTTGLENFTVQLGLGKWITSITMTIFYVVLYHIWVKDCSVYDAPECLAQCSRPAFLGNLSEYSVCTDGIDYHRFVL